MDIVLSHPWLSLIVAIYLLIGMGFSYAALEGSLKDQPDGCLVAIAWLFLVVTWPSLLIYWLIKKLGD